MLIASKDNEDEMRHFLKSIKVDTKGWQFINVNVLDGQDGQETKKILLELIKMFSDYEGIAFPIQNTTKISMIIKLGPIHDYMSFKDEVEEKLPFHKCRVLVRKATAQGLLRLQLDLKAISEGRSAGMYESRRERKENVILIAEDDMFTRQTYVKLLEPYAQIVEADNGGSVLDVYEKYNPDVVILDIHLPKKDGKAIMKDIMTLDSDACVIICSADSIKENIIEVGSQGAIGFLTKPPKREDLFGYIRQCITYYENA